MGMTSRGGSTPTILPIPQSLNSGGVQDHPISLLLCNTCCYATLNNIQQGMRKNKAYSGSER